MSDLTDYTIPMHGERRGLPHVEIEIRQDLIAEEAGQRAWAERLVRLLPEAYRQFSQHAHDNDDGRRHIDHTTRDVPVEIARTTLLFIDVQNFCAVRNGGEFKDLSPQEFEENTAITSASWRPASSPTCSACRPAAARPASR